MVVDELTPDVALKDLGQHRLKDLERPEHLFQVVAAGLPSDFPPLGALPSGFHAGDGLPALPNRTIGREDDVRAIADHVRAVGVRVLTVTGPGGVGKTRLALEAARALQSEFAAGARFVSLAALRRAEDVPAAIVQSLRIIPLSSESAEQAVTRYLSVKQLLLVIDNVEHVPTAARFVSELLDACPGLTVLATSRERLALVGEQRYLVAPLALPRDEKDREALARVPAVALFRERARAHDPGFRLGDANVTAVAEICRRVAQALVAKAIAAPTIADLRERVDRAAERLDEVGNVFQFAHLFAAVSHRAVSLGGDRDAKDFVERAIPLAHKLDAPYLWMMLQGNSGLACLLTGDTDTAAHAFREELSLCRELVALPFASEGLLGLAAVAAVRGDEDRAARLSGAASAHVYDDPEETLVPSRLQAAFFEAARARHGAEAWDAAARDGRALSFEDAINYALQGPHA